MRAADYLVEKLIQYGVTDAFGVPGGVILDFLYALDSRKDQICPHLTFHEQAAGFAAAGYAQVSGTLGVAYATRGPGFTNLITAIADAYQESIPVLFVTAHAQKKLSSTTRMDMDQEIDTVAVVEKITKYAVRVDDLKDFVPKVNAACQCAVSGRMGAVVLDVYSRLWNQDVEGIEWTSGNSTELSRSGMASYAELYQLLDESKRPIILAGNGVQQSGTALSVQKFSEKYKIPILTSRCSQDLFARSDMYFGYIGSHGLRYSNFILSKADLIIALGNRMSFPIQSKSFAPIFDRAKTIRVEIDRAELSRELPNCINYNVDLKKFFFSADMAYTTSQTDEWLEVCRTLKSSLLAYDTEYPVNAISNIFKHLPTEFSVVADVGNNEFWVSRAYAYAGGPHRILYSRSFGTLGNGLPKSIGTYYKTRKPVLCITGDQGLQVNIQELQFIAANSLPIVLLLLNNRSSGMIRSHEKQKYGSRFIHTTLEDGYSVPDFGALALAYGLTYCRMNEDNDISRYFGGQIRPGILEMEIDCKVDLSLLLPKSNVCQNLAPQLPEELYQQLNKL